jgi:hypothetical protein
MALQNLHPGSNPGGASNFLRKIVGRGDFVFGLKASSICLSIAL